MHAAGEIVVKVTGGGNNAMLRAYSGSQRGATAFFRNRPLLETLGDLLRDHPGPELRVLFHAASIGAEPYSFVMHAILSGLIRRFALRISATDINPEFLSYAEAAVYPEAVLSSLAPAERSFFEPAESGTVRVRSDVRERVTFLPARSFVDATFADSFDLVFVLNALTYVTPQQQHEALLRISAYNTDLLVMSAFHPDTVREDLDAAGYVPVKDRIGQIHDSWGGRIRHGKPALPGSPQYSWTVPPFVDTPGGEYRFGSIFRKCGVAGSV
jgi:CheR methyltransferase, SAM binding domain